MIPFLCYAYNLDIGIMPVHTSFRDLDLHATKGLKACIICVLIASGLYATMFILSSYNVS